jgi:hypothetical protein
MEPDLLVAGIVDPEASILLHFSYRRRARVACRYASHERTRSRLLTADAEKSVSNYIMNQAEFGSRKYLCGFVLDRDVTLACLRETGLFRTIHRIRPCRSLT